MAKGGNMYPEAKDGFLGHDEGSNGSPISDVFPRTGSTFAPLDTGVAGGTVQKNSLGTTGKADGQE